MTQPFMRNFSILSLLAVSSSSQAENIEKFMARHCMSCHQNEVYITQKKGLKGLGELETQLHRCFSATGLKVDMKTEYALMDYLNQKFYRFPTDETSSKNH